MKKLDNKGWSMTAMIVLLCVLILFILVVAILSYRAGISKTSPSSIYNEIPDTTENIIEN